VQREIPHPTTAACDPRILNSLLSFSHLPAASPDSSDVTELAHGGDLCVEAGKTYLASAATREHAVLACRCSILELAGLQNHLSLEAAITGFFGRTLCFVPGRISTQYWFGAHRNHVPPT